MGQASLLRPREGASVGRGRLATQVAVGRIQDVDAGPTRPVHFERKTPAFQADRERSDFGDNSLLRPSDFGARHGFRLIM